MRIARMLSPTLNFEVGQVSRYPVALNSSYKEELVKLSKQNRSLVKDYLEEHETSWGFVEHPWMKYQKNHLHGCGDVLLEKVWHYAYETYEKRYRQLLENEETINTYVDEIYQCSSKEMQFETKNTHSIKLPSLQEDACDFLSYLLGCALGRYTCECVQKDKTDTKLLCMGIHSLKEKDLVDELRNILLRSFGQTTLEENVQFLLKNACGYTKLASKEQSKQLFEAYFKKKFYLQQLKRCKKYPFYYYLSSGKHNAFSAYVENLKCSPEFILQVQQDILPRQKQAIEKSLLSDREKIAALNELDTYTKYISNAEEEYQKRKQEAIKGDTRFWFEILKKHHVVQ